MAITDLAKTPNTSQAVEYGIGAAYVHYHQTLHSAITIDGVDLLVGCHLTPANRHWFENKHIGTKQVIQQVPNKAAQARIAANEQAHQHIEGWFGIPFVAHEELDSVIVTVPDIKTTQHTEPVDAGRQGKPIQVGDTVEVTTSGLPTMTGVLRSLEPLLISTDYGDYCVRWHQTTIVRRA